MQKLSHTAAQSIQGAIFWCISDYSGERLLHSEYTTICALDTNFTEYFFIILTQSSHSSSTEHLLIHPDWKNCGKEIDTGRYISVASDIALASF
jgi:hypothetical protein